LLSLVQANPQILQVFFRGLYLLHLSSTPCDICVDTRIIKLQPLLQELGKQNPQILQLIQENQAEFLRLINEPAEGAEGYKIIAISASDIYLVLQCA
jgi:hypothetical protein